MFDFSKPCEHGLAGGPYCAMCVSIQEAPQREREELEQEITRLKKERDALLPREEE